MFPNPTRSTLDYVSYLNSLDPECNKFLTKNYRSGYVGDGMLSAVACGDIFASPSMKQILAAIAAVPSDQGTILLITNYTGDKLHFGLAAERALAGGFSK